MWRCRRRSWWHWRAIDACTALGTGTRHKMWHSRPRLCFLPKGRKRRRAPLDPQPRAAVPHLGLLPSEGVSLLEGLARRRTPPKSLNSQTRRAWVKIRAQLLRNLFMGTTARHWIVAALSCTLLVAGCHSATPAQKRAALIQQRRQLLLQQMKAKQAAAAHQTSMIDTHPATVSRFVKA